MQCLALNNTFKKRYIQDEFCRTRSMDQALVDNRKYVNGYCTRITIKLCTIVPHAQL